jgi:hypothetical protein
MTRPERSGTCVARGQTLERPGADPLDHLLPRPQLAPRVGAPGARPPLSGEVLDGPPGIADTDPGIAGETTMARQRRVVTPDGRVWHVRGAGPSGGRRGHASPASRPPGSTPNRSSQPRQGSSRPRRPVLLLWQRPRPPRRARLRRRHDERHAARTMVGMLAVGFLVVGTLVSAFRPLRPAVAPAAPRRERPADPRCRRRGGGASHPRPPAPALARRAPAARPYRRSAAGLACPGMAQQAPDGPARHCHPGGSDRQRARRRRVPRPRPQATPLTFPRLRCVGVEGVVAARLG